MDGYEEEERNRIASDIAIFLGGAIAGAVIGLMLAPRSGRALRAQLLEYGREAQGKSTRAIRRASNRARHAISDSRIGEHLGI